MKNEQDSRISTWIESAFASIARRVYENINRHDEIEEYYASGSEMDIYSINVIGTKKLSWKSDDTNILYM